LRPAPGYSILAGIKWDQRQEGAVILGKSVAAIVVLAFLGITGAAATRLGEFRIEASSESLVLEDDPDMRIYDETRVGFGNDEYVFVTLSSDDLFTPTSIAEVARLTKRFEALDGVRDVLSPTNVRLFMSTARPLNPIMLQLGGSKSLPMLGDRRVVMEKARKELVEHAMYGGNLVSRDGRTASMIVTLSIDPKLLVVMNKFLALKAQRDAARGSEHERLAAAAEELAPEYRRMETARKDRRIGIVRAIRKIVQEERAKGLKVNASGLPSIVVDMVDFVEADLQTFSVAAAAFLCLFLGLVFRRVRWVLLPLMACLGTAVWIVALLVLEGKRTTVITCNIPSLLVIIGLAHAIHLIVCYREQIGLSGSTKVAPNLRATLRAIAEPCLYTALTTAVGFLSLMVSGIRPIIDFGTHMALGAVLALLLSFIVLPAGLLLLPPLGAEDARMPHSSWILGSLAGFALAQKKRILGLSALLVLASVYGISQLDTDTRFIDYFRDSSELHKGLVFIDQELGGTTTIEVVLQSDKPGTFRSADGLAAIQAVEKFMGERPEIGTVVGLGSVVTQGQRIFASMGQPRLPPVFVLRAVTSMLGRESLASYVNEDFSEVRVVGRVIESRPELDRPGLIKALRRFVKSTVLLDSEGKARPWQGHVTGMFVLYANMLASLVGSQWQTITAVLILVFLMLAILLRSPRAAAVGMVPNILPIVLVLGIMGLLGIHLDMATIMIASISLGIAVDGTIHYCVRYRAELAKDGDPAAAVKRSHKSIGTAIFFTTLTSIVGFWVLALSNFKPNIYFGVFTGVAMLAALFGTLTLLPILLVWSESFAKPRDKAG